MISTIENLKMRQLIRDLARTPGGYQHADVKNMASAGNRWQEIDRMLKLGEVVRVKVVGQLQRFVANQEMADALRAVLVAIPRKKRIRNRAKPTAQRLPAYGPLHLLIVAIAASSMGVTFDDCAHITQRATAFGKCTSRLVLTGKLHRAKVAGHPFRYFCNKDDAEAWHAATPPIVKVYPRKKSYIKRVRTPKLPQLVKVKAVKPAAAPRKAVGRKEITTAKPPPNGFKNAVVIDGPNVIRTYRPMPDRHAVTVVRQKIGTASWVTL